MTYYIGIDPGLSGAVAIRDDSYGLVVHDTPTLAVKAGSTKRDYLMAGMAAILAPFGPDAVAAVEYQQAMPKQGVSSTFTTGKGYGLWLGLLTAYGIPFDIVRPPVWKKAIGLPAGADKGVARGLASQLFPAQADQFKRVKDDGRADAALIAEYRKRVG